MAKRKSVKSRSYKKQYAELLENAKMIYNDLQLGLKLGEQTPSIERVLKEAGTKSGLKKPTKKSIKALKKLQSEAGVLRQVYWSMPKGEARETAKELFNKAYEEEEHIKRLRRAEKRIEKAIDGINEELKRQDIGKEEKARLQSIKSDLEEAKKDMVSADTYRFLLEVRKQVQRAIEPFAAQRIQTAWSAKVLAAGRAIVSFINDVLTRSTPEEMRQYEENARRVIEQFGTIEAEDLYMYGYEILDDLRLLKLKEELSMDLTENQKEIINPDGINEELTPRNPYKKQAKYNASEEWAESVDIWDMLE